MRGEASPPARSESGLCRGLENGFRQIWKVFACFSHAGPSPRVLLSRWLGHTETAGRPPPAPPTSEPINARQRGSARSVRPEQGLAGAGRRAGSRNSPAPVAPRTPDPPPRPPPKPAHRTWPSSNLRDSCWEVWQSKTAAASSCSGEGEVEMTMSNSFSPLASGRVTVASGHLARAARQSPRGPPEVAGTFPLALLWYL